MEEIKVPIGVSARHIHLSLEDKERLFGPGYKLTPRNPLSQKGQFACEEEVEILGPKGRSLKLRILGPERKSTQIELSLTDAIFLGLQPPVRDSGDIEGSPGAKIIGPKGIIEIEKGVIIPWRHIHTPTPIAEKLGLYDKQLVKVRLGTIRAVVFENVLIRVRDDFTWELHLDTDEANAAMVKTGDIATLILEEVREKVKL
ncbi:MAG: phosphate propanoyltransferase [Dictyoglomaceae bacterium]